MYLNVALTELPFIVIHYQLLNDGQYQTALFAHQMPRICAYQTETNKEKNNHFNKFRIFQIIQDSSISITHKDLCTN